MAGTQSWVYAEVKHLEGKSELSVATPAGLVGVFGGLTGRFFTVASQRWGQPRRVRWRGESLDTGRCAPVSSSR